MEICSAGDEPHSNMFSRPVVGATILGKQTSALLDQGCQPGNLMSEEFFNELRKDNPSLELDPCSDVFAAADKQGSKVCAKGRVRQIPLYLSHGDLEYKGCADFIVATCRRNLLMGFPWLTQDGYTFNASVMKSHHNQWRRLTGRLTTTVENLEDLTTQERQRLTAYQEAGIQDFERGEVNVPFSSNQDLAPEEELIPEIPFAPRDVLGLADDYDERLQAYLESIHKQVDPEFAKAIPSLMDFLKSPEAHEVFIPKTWDGIRDPTTGKVIIHKIEWLTLPDARKVRVIRIRPDVVVAAKREVEKLRRIGFWVWSDSHIASTMLVAPKATDPFIRLVTDYSWLTKNFSVPKHPLKHVKDSLLFMTTGDRVTGETFKVWCDLDMMASFHQLRIDDESSELLSVVTPWGQYKPTAVPEGIAPATAILQKAVDKVFQSHQHRLLAIYDNLLLAGTSHEDMFTQLKNVLATCRRSNLILKHTKCWFGVPKVKFFGYVCDAERYYLDDQRVQGIKDVEFPGTVGNTRAQKVKAMQSYLGMAQFFSGFIPNYAVLTSKLTDMVKDSYDWKCCDQMIPAFEEHKRLIANSFCIFHPRYDWEWTLRVDASSVGVGGILLQRNADSGVLEPLCMCSKKFSPQAQRWHVLHQEGFAIVFSVLHAAFLLRGKHFTLETDHRNLLWMETSKDPKIVRMVETLKTFSFDTRHIPGKLNLVADVLSRAFDVSLVSLQDLSNLAGAIFAVETSPSKDTTSPLRQVHGERMGHHGALRTWQLLNEYFPGHGLSMAQVAEWVSECLVCQQTRLRAANRGLQPIKKHLVASHARHKVCVDGTTVLRTPGSSTNLLVFVNLFTKHVALYAMPDKTALSAARAFFRYFATFGLCDVVHSDLGSDFTSSTVAELLNKWLGIRQTFALQGNPQADGVEPTVKAVLRHLSALVQDGMDPTDWSLPEHLLLVQLVLNEHVHHDTGVVPMHATFGNLDAEWLHIPDMPQHVCSMPFLQALGDHLRTLRERSAAYLQRTHARRDGEAPPANRFQAGDFVLYLLPKEAKSSKLTPRNAGPYRVLRHKEGSNHVEVTDLVAHTHHVFDLKDLQVCVATPDQALAAARRAAEEVVVLSVRAFRGDPLKRSSVEFLVDFADGDSLWVPFSAQLALNECVETFCNTSRYHVLRMLFLTVAQVRQVQTSLARLPIPVKDLGATLFVNLRSYGADWYQSRHQLPDRDTVAYYIQAAVVAHPRNRRKFLLTQPVFGSQTVHDLFYLEYFGTVRTLVAGEVLLTVELCSQYGILEP